MLVTQQKISSVCDQHDAECLVMVSMNWPSNTRETTLLPANEQSGGGGGGDEEAGASITSIFIYITI